MLVSGQKNTGRPGIFGLYFMQECKSFLGVFYHVKKLLQNTLFWRFFLAFFLQKMAILQEFFWVFLPCKKARPKHNVLEGFLAFFNKKILPNSCQNP